MREKIVSEMADSDTGIQNVLTFEVLRKFLEMILKMEVEIYVLSVVGKLERVHQKSS